MLTSESGKNETFFEEAVAPVSLQNDDDEEDNMTDDSILLHLHVHGMHLLRILDTPDPTLNAMEKMFEGIFSNIEVTIHNLSIFLETPGNKSVHR